MKLLINLRKSPLGRRRWIAVLPMAAGLLVVLAFAWGRSHKIFPQQAFCFLSAPLLVFLFLRRVDKEENVYAPFSPRNAIVGLYGFVLAIYAPALWKTGALLMGVAGALFTFIEYNAFARLSARHARLAVPAAVGALSGAAYWVMQKYFWKWTAMATAKTLYLLLHKFVPHLSVVEKRPPPPPMPGRFYRRVVRRIFRHGQPPPKPRPPSPPLPPEFVAVVSDHFTLRFAILENAWNGVFMFLLLFSVLAVLARKPWSLRRLAALYLAGAAFMFAANALAMTLYFWISAAAFAPGAGGFLLALGKILRFMALNPWMCLAAHLAAFALFMLAARRWVRA